jgi:hypothetical protein
MTNRDRTGSGGARKKEAGFALVVAILALMLLTFLGLALAATTSTELQIATNYRWSQQALYNAEAGLQVGKLLLMSLDWGNILPPPRTVPWQDATPATAPAPLRSRTDPFGFASRNYAYANCDRHYGQVGAGVVLDDGSGTAPYQNVSTILGKTLNGTFTIWVRRPVTVNAAGITDNTGNDQLILTSEGTAPYTSQPANSPALAFTRVNKAVRLLETTITSAEPQECGGGGGQRGLGSGGAGFNPCVPLNDNFGNLGGRTAGVAGLGTMTQGGGGVARGTVR